MEISEIFYSIQGEGKRTGTPTIFIRFYGCNYDCSFCDEPLHKIHKVKKTQEQILKEIQQYPCKDVTITGGEPTLHNLNNFISFLQENKYYVSVETNGHNLENVKNADWITCSPKFKEEILSNKVNEYKIVTKDQKDIKEALKYTKICKDVYIQPLNNIASIDKENLQFCIGSILKNSDLRLSLQVHKILGVE